MGPEGKHVQSMLKRGAGCKFGGSGRGIGIAEGENPARWGGGFSSLDGVGNENTIPATYKVVSRTHGPRLIRAWRKGKRKLLIQNTGSGTFLPKENNYKETRRCPGQ